MFIALYSFRSRFEGAPGLASQFFFSTGSIKFVMGFLIFVLFLPHCPEGCSDKVCARTKIPSPLYAFISTAIGILWMYRGYTFLQRANRLENGASKGAHDNMFSTLPQDDSTDATDGVDGEEEYVEELEIV